MPTPGDVVQLNLGTPEGSEAGLVRPAVVVAAARVLQGAPNVVQVVPLTRTIRPSGVEVMVEPDSDNGPTAPSAAQCQHVRPVAVRRVERTLGNIGAVTLAEVRDVLGLLLDVPTR